MDEKLTRKSQEALSEAVQTAASAGNPSVDGLHLLTALVQQEGGTAAPLLRAVGADPADILKKARDLISRLPRRPAQPSARPRPRGRCLPRWPRPGSWRGR